jgi:deoxyribonuclease-1
MKPSYLFFTLLLVGVALYQEYQQQPSSRSSSADLDADQSLSKVMTSNAKRTTNGSKSHASLQHTRPIKDYKTARHLLWGKVYGDGGTTLYCGEPFGERHGKGINVEHVFPMSWATSSVDCGTRNTCRRNSKTFNHIEADLHNLFPSRTDVNKDRSSYRFGEIKGETRHYGKHCDFEVSQSSRIAEPAVEVRGDVARAMFYMADRYREQGLVIFRKQAELLLRWHQDDPPSATDKRRNDLIEKIQGNRNIFVDDPNQLDILFRNGGFESPR